MNPYLLTHPLPYWRNEVSGHLADAIETLVMGEPLESHERSLVAAYLKIWSDYPGWQTGDGRVDALRQNFDALVAQGTTETIWQWLNQAMDIGIDPL